MGKLAVEKEVGRKLASFYAWRPECMGIILPIVQVILAMLDVFLAILGVVSALSRFFPGLPGTLFRDLLVRGGG